MSFAHYVCFVFMFCVYMFYALCSTLFFISAGLASLTIQQPRGRWKRGIEKGGTGKRGTLKVWKALQFSKAKATEVGKIYRLTASLPKITLPVALILVPLALLPVSIVGNRSRHFPSLRTRFLSYATFLTITTSGRATSGFDRWQSIATLSDLR